MTSLAVILYEDERGPQREFGLHMLILACVADDLGRDPYEIKKWFEPRPMNGVNKVLESCRRDVRRIAARGERVFALIDDDHVREHVPGMDARADAPAVEAAIKASSNAPEQLEVILLHKNTESVVEAAKLCDPSLPDTTVREALRKDRVQRDRIFHRVALGAREFRTCIRGKIPAIEKLVELLVAITRGTISTATS